MAPLDYLTARDVIKAVRPGRQRRRSPGCRRSGCNCSRRSGRLRLRRGSQRLTNSGGALTPSDDRAALRAALSRSGPLSDVRADRGVPLHLSGARRWSTPIPRRSGRAIPVRRSAGGTRPTDRAPRRSRASWSMPARWSRKVTGAMPSGRRSASAPRPPLRRMAAWPCGPATRCAMGEDGLLRFIGRDDEMIKSAGNRISPTEIEEAVLLGRRERRGGGVRRAGRAAGPGASW